MTNICPYQKNIFESTYLNLTADCNAPVWDLWDNQNNILTQKIPFMVNKLSHYSNACNHHIASISRSMMPHQYLLLLSVFAHTG